jgi:hypothetical protein
MEKKLEECEKNMEKEETLKKFEEKQRKLRTS